MEFKPRPLCYRSKLSVVHPYSADMLYKRGTGREVKARTKICGFSGIQTQPLCYYNDVVNVLLSNLGDMLNKSATGREMKARTKI